MQRSALVCGRFALSLGLGMAVLSLAGCGWYSAQKDARAAEARARAAEAEARSRAEAALSQLEAAKKNAGNSQRPPPAIGGDEDLSHLPFPERKARQWALAHGIPLAAEEQEQKPPAAEQPPEKPAESPKPPPDPNLAHVLQGHEGPVLCVAYSPDGSRVASGSTDKTIRIWDPKAGKELASLKGHADAVTALAFSADGRQLFSGSADKTIRAWDLDSKKELHTYTGHTDRITGLAVTADGQRLLSSSMDKTVKVWPVMPGPELNALKGHTLGVLAVIVTDDGKFAITAGQDRTLRLWNVETGMEIGRVDGHKGWVTTLGLSDDESFILSGSLDGTFMVSRLTRHEPTLRSMFRKDTQGGAVYCVVFRGPHKALIAGEEGIIRLLRGLDSDYLTLASYNRLSLQGHNGPVRAAALSPDGLTIISGGDDKTVRIWKVPRE